MFSFLAMAQDEGLYAPAPPADAAFVRIAHAAMNVPVVSIKIGDVSYGELEYRNVTPYRVVSQGEHTVTLNAKRERIEVQVGRFYTLTITS